MIFGTSRAISRKNSEVEGRDILIVDMKDVKHLGVSAALSLEEAILDMVNADRSVYIVGREGQPMRRLGKLGLLKMIPEENIFAERIVAIEHACEVSHVR